MPRRRPIRVSVLAELTETLVRRPRAEGLRAARSADALAADLDPAELYPEDWLVHRLTGRQPTITEPRLVPGEALLGDLSAVVERLTDAVRATPDEAGADRLSHAGLLARWNISPKTLHRLREDGLTAWVIRPEGRRPQTAYTRIAVEAFEARHADRLARAARFSRANDDLSTRLFAAAAEERAQTGCSLHTAARRLAPSFGLSVEGVRQLLRRRDAEAARDGCSPIFPEPGPPSHRTQRALARLVARGAEPAELAAATGRRTASIRRAAHEGRADLLRRLMLAPPIAVDASALLSSVATRGLGRPGPPDAHSLLAEARLGVAPPAPEERARAAAMRALHARAAARIAAFPSSGVPATDIDAAETDLRWASLLKADLLRPLLGVLVRTIESRAGVPAEAMPTAALSNALRRSFAAASAAADTFDPAHGSRLAARVGIAVDRALSGNRHGGQASVVPGRAARTLTPGAIPLRDVTLSMDPWQRWLAIDPRVRAGAAALRDRPRRVLERRFGLDGSPPETLAAIAAQLGLPIMHTARLERRALREARGAASPGGTVPSEA